MHSTFECILDRAGGEHAVSPAFELLERRRMNAVERRRREGTELEAEQADQRSGDALRSSFGDALRSSFGDAIVQGLWRMRSAVDMTISSACGPSSMKN